MEELTYTVKQPCGACKKWSARVGSMKVVCPSCEEPYDSRACSTEPCHRCKILTKLNGFATECEVCIELRDAVVEYVYRECVGCEARLKAVDKFPDHAVCPLCKLDQDSTDAWFQRTMPYLREVSDSVDSVDHSLIIQTVNEHVLQSMLEGADSQTLVDKHVYCKHVNRMWKTLASVKNE